MRVEPVRILLFFQRFRLVFPFIDLCHHSIDDLSHRIFVYIWQIEIKPLLFLSSMLISHLLLQLEVASRLLDLDFVSLAIF